MKSTIKGSLLAGVGTRLWFLRRVPKPVVVAGIGVLTLGLLALGADFVAQTDARSVDLQAVLHPPSFGHPFGTDEMGRDLGARLLHGLRISFTISTLAAMIAVFIGGIVGILAGALGGWLDGILMRLVDLLSSQNHLLLGILLVVLFRPVIGGAAAVMLSVGMTHWTTVARIVRAELLSLRERHFISAAINGGADRVRLAWRHFLPHVLPSIGLGLVLLVPHAIFHESALSFLGLGLPPHQASLGNILADGRHSLLAGAWWTSLFPGGLMFVVVLGIGTVGEYLRDLLSPRWHSELEL